MSASDGLNSIPFIEGGEEPTFPTPWAARAFAMTLALHEQGQFTWPEWSEKLAEFVNRDQDNTYDSETYWVNWLGALCAMVAERGLGSPGELNDLIGAWRQVAEETPHGEPLDLQQTVIEALAQKAL